MKKVAAIVLAAGMSKRMGTMKQLVKMGERTLLETTLSAVQSSRIQETILVLGYQADEILKTVKLPSTIQFVTNESYEKGMSTSIRAGISAISPDSAAALIVLADQPFLKPSIINALIEEYESTDAAILLPVYKGFRGNPVLIDRSLFPEMMQIEGDIGCRSLFGIHADKIHKVPVDDIGVLIDIDSPEDLARISNFRNGASSEVLRGLQLGDRSVQTDQRRLLIVGQDEIAGALVKLARLLNFRVTVVDPLLTLQERRDADQILNELDFTKVEITSSTYIVVASRGKYDEEALQQALVTPARYIALVGSKKRGAEIIERLRNQVPDEALKRIRCPAGLEIHASSPEEIALSVMAEIVQFDRSVAKN
jgi:molybdenum cofactor cytidylyltransferase